VDCGGYEKREEARILWDRCKLGVDSGNEGSNEMIKGVWNDSFRNSV
jgi:hypothetical protein